MASKSGMKPVKLAWFDTIHNIPMKNTCVYEYLGYQ